MKKQIDYILLGILWILVVTLGASFWFNTQYGFNIFSGTHWRYLADVQMTGAHVRPWFYISMGIWIAIMIGGFYMLMLPRVRGLRLGARIRAHHRSGRQRQSDVQNQPAPQQPIMDAPSDNASTMGNVPGTNPTSDAPTIASAPSSDARPPRLVLGNGTPRPNTPPPAFAMAPTQPITDGASIADITELKRIFTNAGYTVKPSAKISGMNIDLFAIAMGEILWMGGIGMAPERLAKSVKRIDTLFKDTLDDIPINIHAFIVDPHGAHESDIMTFSDMKQLESYINAHPAQPIPDDAREDFNAYNEYIDTVTNFLATTMD